MASLNDLSSVAQRQFGTATFFSGLVAAATTAGKLKTVTNTIQFMVDGVWGTPLAATDNLTMAAPTAAQLPLEYGRWVYYNISATDVARTFYCVIAHNIAGEIVCFQGDYSGQDLTFRGMPLVKGTGLIPQIPEGFAPFAIVKVANPASLAWTMGTTAFTTASSRVVTISNVCVLPKATTL